MAAASSYAGNLSKQFLPAPGRWIAYNLRIRLDLDLFH